MVKGDHGIGRPGGRPSLDGLWHGGGGAPCNLTPPSWERPGIETALIFVRFQRAGGATIWGANSLLRRIRSRAKFIPHDQSRLPRVARPSAPVRGTSHARGGREKFCRRKISVPKALLADSLGDSGIAGMLIQGGLEGVAMPSAVRLRDDYSWEDLRALARPSKDVNQSRRLRSLAAVRDGMDRGSAAKIGGMDRQTLRDWVHRFNASGPEGLIDTWVPPSGSGRTDRRGV